MNSLPPSTWTDCKGAGRASITSSRKRLALKAVAREKTRATMKRLTGQTARTRRVRRNLLDGLPVAGEGHVVDLDELAGAPGPGAVLPALRPAVELAAAPGLEAALADAGAGHAARPSAMARERMRPTVDTLRRRPPRSSMRWIGALPMNGCLRRRSMTAFASPGLYDGRRTRRGRVDSGSRPRWPRAASAAFHRNTVRRLTPISSRAACSAQPAARSASKRRMASRRPRACSDAPTARRRPPRSCGTIASAWTRCSWFGFLQWVCVHRRLPEPAPAADIRCRSRAQPVMAAAVPNLSEPAQRFAQGRRQWTIALRRRSAQRTLSSKATRGNSRARQETNMPKS